MNILGISGSLRAESFNSKLLAAVVSMLPDGAGMEILPLHELPLFSEDLETDELPAPVTVLRDAIAQADALFIATPEYNFGMPGVLKNAIDWASRPPFNSPLVNKPTGIVSVSLAPTGGARAQSNLKQVLSGTLTPVYPAPEYQIGSAHGAFDEQGGLIDATAIRRLQRFVDGFVAWSRGIIQQA